MIPRSTLPFIIFICAGSSLFGQIRVTPQPNQDRRRIFVEGVIPDQWPTAKAPENGAPTFVLLPPRVESDEAKLLRPAAQLLCDALAAQLGASGKVQLVDRTQIDQILKEHKLQPAGAVRPLTSFDAMIRLDMRLPLLNPRVEVAVIDLSTGNRLSNLTLEWPLEEDSLPRMTKSCLEGVKISAERKSTEEQRRKRIRILGTIYPEEAPQLRPLADRVRTSIEGLIDKSADYERVEHLGADSSVQESLFLYMGMSQLGDGGQFLPSADATIELKLVEGKLSGETFEKTPILLQSRLWVGGQLDGDWREIQGTPADLDSMLADLSTNLTNRLAKVGEGAAEVVNDPKLRRKLAVAELKAKRPHPDFDYKQIPERMAAVHRDIQRDLTALKIDPTYEEAKIALLEDRMEYMMAAQAGVMYELHSDAIARDAIADFIKEVDGQIANPVAQREKLINVLTRGPYFVRRLSTTSRMKQQRLFNFSPFDLELLQFQRRVVEFSLSDTRTLEAATSQSFSSIHLGMVTCDDDVADRVAWLNKMADACQKLRESQPKAQFDDFRGRILVLAHLLITNKAYDDAARLMMRHEQFLFAEAKRDRTFVARLRNSVHHVDHPELTDRFDDTFGAPLPNMPAVTLLEHWWNDWPSPKMFAESLTVPTTSLIKRYPDYPSMSAIAANSRRAYVNLRYGSKIPRFAYFETDEDGHLPERGGMHSMSQPKLNLPLGRYKAVATEQGLYLASSAGLLTYDARRDSWRHFTSKDGLPADDLRSVFSLDANTLFCTGRAGTLSVHFTFDLAQGASRLTFRSAPKTSSDYADMKSVVQRDGKWSGLVSGHRFTDLIGKQPQVARFGLSPERVADLGSRRYVMSYVGMQEIDNADRVLKSWPRAKDIRIRFGHRSNLEMSIPGLAKSQPTGNEILSCGNLLIMHPGLIAYDPAADTWYGPFQMAAKTSVATKHGIWVNSGRGVAYVLLEDLRQAAKAGKRIYTTQAYLDRRKAAILAGDCANSFTGAWGIDAPDDGLDKDFNRGLLAMRAQNWPLAATAFAQCLKKHPDNPFALYYAGFVHDRWCLKQPVEALPFYERLAKHPNRKAAFTGAYWVMHNCMRQKKYDRVLELSDQMKKDFPVIGEAGKDISHWTNEARRLSKHVDSTVKPK